MKVDELHWGVIFVSYASSIFVHNEKSNARDKLITTIKKKRIISSQQGREDQMKLIELVNDSVIPNMDATPGPEHIGQPLSTAAFVI